MSRSYAVTMSAEPNVTPMIDVLLVLLIIFMARIPEARRTLDAQLPADGKDAGVVVPIVLEVRAGPQYFVNQQPVAAMRLERFLRDVYALRPDKTIIVKGANAAKYQDVILALDAARGAGVTIIGVDTKRY